MFPSVDVDKIWDFPEIRCMHRASKRLQQKHLIIYWNQ